MMSTRTGVRALVMVTLCYGALEIVGLLLLLLLLFIRFDRTHERDRRTDGQTDRQTPHGGFPASNSQMVQDRATVTMDD